MYFMFFKDSNAENIQSWEKQASLFTVLWSGINNFSSTSTSFWIKSKKYYTVKMFKMINIQM